MCAHSDSLLSFLLLFIIILIQVYRILNQCLSKLDQPSTMHIYLLCSCQLNETWVTSTLFACRLVRVRASADIPFLCTILTAVSEQFQSSFRAVSEQFQSSFRAVSEQF